MNHQPITPLKILFLSTLFCVLSSSVFAENDLSKTSKGIEISTIRIIVPEAPNAVEKWATTDLSEYLGKIAGRKSVKIISEKFFSKSSEIFPIYVGRTKPGLELLNKQTKPFGPDEYLIEGGIKEGRLVIVGHDTPYNPKAKAYKYKEDPSRIPGIGTRSSLGTCRAAWYLLHHYGTVRWYLPGPLGEVVPQSKYFKIPEQISMRNKPDFEFRSIGSVVGRGTTLEFDKWHFRVGFGQAGVRLSANHFLHKMPRYITDKKLDPKMINLQGGKRTANNYSVCHNYPGIAPHILDRLLSYYTYNKLIPESLPVMPVDGFEAYNICECELCKKDRQKALTILKQEKANKTPFHSRKSTSHYVWPLVLKVAAEAKKRNLNDVYISGFAYSSFGTPPKTPKRFPDNVGIQLCKERLLYVDRKQKQEDRRRLMQWAKKCENISAWEYYCWHVWGNPIPLICPKEIAEDLKFLKGKVIGEEIEIHSTLETPMMKTGQWFMDGLNIYITARYLLDADQDINAVLDEYYKLFFGPAWKTMKIFYEDLEKQWAMNPKKARQANKYSYAFAKLCMNRLEKALTEVPQDSIFAERLKRTITDFTPWYRLVKSKHQIPEYDIAIVKQAPAIDGNLNEKAWEHAKPIKFTLSAGHRERGGYPDELNSSVKMLRYNDKIYIAANIGTQRDHPKARASSAKPYKTERFRAIFAAPNGKRFVLTIPVKGKMQKKIYTQIDKNKNIEWNIKPEIKQQYKDGRWNIEICIPTDKMKLNKNSGSWRFNSQITSTCVLEMDFFRSVLVLNNSHRNNAYILSWQPEAKEKYKGQRETFNPKYYGRLVFKKAQ